MEASVPALASLWDQLKRRRVFRALFGYGAGAFALLQAAQPVFAGLLLPDFAFRFLVVLVLAGFPVAVILAWVYEVTEDGIRRTPRGSGGPTNSRWSLRRWLQVGGVFLLVAVLAAGTAAGVGRARYPASGADGRVGLAVFPFHAAPGTYPVWSDGAADLLTTALDGTAGLRIVDPWTLWRPLRPAPDAPAGAPEADRALELTQEAGAQRYLLGSVVPSGERVQIALRLYQIGRSEPISTFTVGAPADSVSQAVREAALGVLAHIWGPSRPADLPSDLDFRPTQSPEALQAYLAAKAAFRTGRVDSASRAIDRAVALDSTFVLATAEAVTIKSWGQFVRGRPYEGFFALLARAEPFADSVPPRTRLRLEATLASTRTRGPEAWSACRGILEIDPQDFVANSLLAYVEQVYGWQIGLPFGEGREQAETVVGLDSTFVPSLVTRAWWAVALGDTADERHQLARLLAADTASDLAAGAIAGLRADVAGDEAFAAMLPELTALSASRQLAVVRSLRVDRPERARALLRAMAEGGDPMLAVQVEGERVRMEIAEGRLARLDSALARGGYDRGGLRGLVQRWIVAGALHGVERPATTRRAVAGLRASLPQDSALAWFESKPVWPTAWVLGAWNAAEGDTAEARRWLEVMEGFPRGGSPERWAEALRADVESRLAERRGDSAAALSHARRAFELWSIHTENTFEAQPEPAMRFHLGELYRAAGRPDSARAMFRSLVPPTAWLGFLTARASLELGRLARERGDTARARFHFGRALRMWDAAGPAGTAWRERARRGLDELTGE